MKFVQMSKRKEKPVLVPPQRDGKVDGAFDLWLKRGLHQLYDDIANEPVPEELLKLIEEDRNK